MSILNAKSNKVKKLGHFTQIDDSLIMNENLSAYARLIYIMLESCGRNWKFNAKYLAKKCGISLTTFYKYIKELYEADLLKRIQEKDKHGRYTTNTLYVLNSYNEDELLEIDINVEQLDKSQVAMLKENTEAILDSLESRFLDNDMEGEVSLMTDSIKDAEPFATTKSLSHDDNLDFIMKKASYDSSEVAINETTQNTHSNTDVKIFKVPKSNSLNNIKESNNINLEITNPKVSKTENLAKSKTLKSNFALIDLKSLLEQCKTYLRERKLKEQEKLKIKKCEREAFLQNLTENEKIAYERFIKYRREGKDGKHYKMIKNSTIKSIQKSILKLKDSGQDICEVINTSINRGWIGLFAIKSVNKSFKYPPKHKPVSYLDTKEGQEWWAQLEKAEAQAIAAEQKEVQHG